VSLPTPRHRRPAPADGFERLTWSYAALYPDEVAAQLEETATSEAAALLSGLPTDTAVSVLARTSSEVGVDVFSGLDGAVQASLVEAMEPARAVALLIRLGEPAREAVLAKVSVACRRDLKSLLDYPPGSAGQLMDPVVITLRASDTVGHALDRVRGVAPRRVFDVFLVDSDGRLVASAGIQDLATAAPDTPVRDVARSKPARVADIAGRQEIESILEGQRISSLPVVDFEQRVVGVIRYDTLIDTVEGAATSDIQRMVGVSREERALSSVGFSVRKRLPWLHVNLGTAFVAASVVGLFESTIARFTALAVLLPVVAGQSGNTGAQALAVVMRGLALREITPRHWLRVMTKEALTGLVNGSAVAIVTGTAVYAWSGSYGLGLVIAIAMVASMAIAALAGAGIPLILEAMGQDPASSSSIILTTVTDVAGFFSFLGLATIFASLL
jgi:magnesium transporter